MIYMLFHNDINVLALSLVTFRLTNLGFMLSAHSMEEADALCDRLGIFVNGSLQCIGNPKEVHFSSVMLYGTVFQNETLK